MKNRFSDIRKVALTAAVAACAIAVPAQARDGQGYAGIDAGIVIPKISTVDVGATADAYRLDHKSGWEADGVVGYDWGIIRTEAEVAYKHFKPKSLSTQAPYVVVPGTIVNNASLRDLGGHETVLTAMANALLDFGGNDGAGVSLGVGAGRSWLDSHISTGGT